MFVGPKYKIELAYFGKPFVGFQSQPCGNAIQDHLEKALGTFLAQDIRIVGASRTDSGVHAEQQIVTFSTDKPFNKFAWLRGLNALTPKEISIKDISLVDNEFHPIHSAKAKAYRYRVWLGNCWNPFVQPFVWEVIPPIDVQLLTTEASKLVGEYDFTSFCNTDTDIMTKTRKLLEVKIEQKGPLLNFWFIGEGFLKQMVRIIVGTLIDISCGKLETPIDLIINRQDRRLAGITAPGKGLTLVKVFYNDVAKIDALITESEQGFCQSI
ncbi:MAG: tRNA pseudouridine(38-40) synthase TruA [Bdellovibrionota bacterium]